MNANELAEVLEDVGMEQKHYDTIQKAAIMLRQQQAEIEAFKKDNKELHAIAQRMAMAESDARKSLQWFKDAQERQNEPVAWMDYLEHSDLYDLNVSGRGIPLYTHPVKEQDEPVAIVNTNCENNIQWYDDNPKQHNGYFLYTHPAKTLTDEEIKELSEKHLDMDWQTGVIEFARAILKKAQKK